MVEWRLRVAGRRGAADNGSGTVLAIALMAALGAMLSVLLGLHAVLACHGSVANAADAAALAAADARVGAVSGYPCERARQVAERNGATLVSCTVDGLLATVEVRGEIVGLGVVARSSAGPAS